MPIAIAGPFGNFYYVLFVVALPMFMVGLVLYLYDSLVRPHRGPVASSGISGVSRSVGLIVFSYIMTYVPLIAMVMATYLFLLRGVNNGLVALAASLASPFVALAAQLSAESLLHGLKRLGFLKFWPGRGANVLEVKDRSLVIPGFVIAGLTFAVALVGSKGLSENEFFRNHEMAHVRGKHNLWRWMALYTLLIPVSLYLQWVFNHNAVAPFFREDSAILGAVLSLAASSAIAVAILVIRACEVDADYRTYKSMGPKAWSAYQDVVGRSPRPAALKFLDDLIHTGRRDLVLKEGDPAAPYAPWEFPLVFGLLSSTLETYFFSTYIHDVLGPSPVLPFIIAGSTFLGSFAVIYLLGLVLKPVLRLISKPWLTDRGTANVARLVSGLYLFSSSLGLLLFRSAVIYGFLSAYLLGFLVNYVIIKRYIWRRALAATLAVYAVTIAVNILILLTALSWRV